MMAEARIARIISSKEQNINKTLKDQMIIISKKINYQSNQKAGVDRVRSCPPYVVSTSEVQPAASRKPGL